MKLKKIKRENGTYRLASQPVGKSMTDQSDKNMTDINLIMERYAKTGVLPQTQQKLEQYLDMTQLPSYMEAHARIKAAEAMYMELPAQIRKDMGNNPANLEAYVQDPANKDMLEKYGIIEKSYDAPASSQSDNASEPAVAKSE
jgi:hypothetical protein